MKHQPLIHRRLQHVGVLSDGIWTAHSRRAGDNGVSSPNINTSTDFDDFESFITRRWASEARELSKNLATGTPLNRERLGMALDNLAVIAEREANRNGADHG